MDLKRRTVGLTLPFIFGDAAAIFCGTEFYHTADWPVSAGSAVLVILTFLCFIIRHTKKGNLYGTCTTLLSAA